MSYEELLKKWEPVLEHPEFAEIKDPYKKKVTAILLENQDRDMEQGRGSLHESSFAQPSGELGVGFSSGAAAAGPVAGMDPVMISMIRRSMPNLVAFDMMGVQPMSGPTGLIFAMRSKYEDQNGDRHYLMKWIPDSLPEVLSVIVLETVNLLFQILILLMIDQTETT